MFIDFRERGRERKRNIDMRETSIAAVRTHNSLVSGMLLQPTEPHWPARGRRFSVKLIRGSGTGPTGRDAGISFRCGPRVDAVHSDTCRGSHGRAVEEARHHRLAKGVPEHTAHVPIQHILGLPTNISSRGLRLYKSSVQNPSHTSTPRSFIP